MVYGHTQARWWPAARQQALVQGDAPDADANEPSALVIGMAMLGALVCLVPLAGFLVLALGERVLMGAPGLVLGVIALAVSGAMLRSSAQAFLNCVALVLWCLGGGLLLVNAGDVIFNSRMGALLIFGLAAALLLLGAWLAQARWIQSIMGLGWAAAVYGVLMTAQSWLPWILPLQLDGLLLALLWALWLHAEPARLAQYQQWWAQPRWAAFADAAVVGVLGSAAFSAFSGRWFDPWAVPALGNEGRWMFGAGRWLAVAAVVLATGWLVRTWRARSVMVPRLQYSVLLAGGLLAVCAWFSTGLGIAALVAAAALLSARWRIAVLCAVIALALLGQFYYLLAWSLAAKGVGLAVLGAVMLAGLLALRPRGEHADHANAAAIAQPRHAQLAWVLLGAVLVFGLVNWDVRGKEQVIANGQRIMVPLVPVDPRSLMQGDYVALRFDMPAAVYEGLESSVAPTAKVRASVDAKGVANVIGLVTAGVQPGPGEVILPLKRLKGRWVLVTDAYFFPEGQGTHFERAKFGDFRVLPDGRALLVGLTDAQGQVIEALPGRSIWDSASARGRNEAVDATEAMESSAEEAAVAVEAVNAAAAASKAAAEEAAAPSPAVR
ncbi:MAG: GDYXXLXY domain-containing protein [Comamonas sp.]